MNVEINAYNSPPIATILWVSFFASPLNQLIRLNLFGIVKPGGPLFDPNTILPGGGGELASL